MFLAPPEGDEYLQKAYESIKEFVEKSKPTMRAPEQTGEYLSKLGLGPQMYPDYYPTLVLSDKDLEKLFK